MTDLVFLIYHGIGLGLFLAIWALSGWKADGWAWFMAIMLVLVWPLVLLIGAIGLVTDWLDDRKRARQEETLKRVMGGL